MNKIKNCESIEIPIIAGTKKYKLPTQTNFRGKKITAIECIPGEIMTYSALSRSIIGNDGLKLGMLTLDVQGKEKVKQVPLRTLSRQMNNQRPFEFDNFIINNDKSYVEFSNPESVDNQSLVLMFFFED